MSFSPWDIALMLVASLQGTAIAYLHQPRAKALLMTFPFPFSLAFLSLGRPVDVTNILGLALLLIFFHAVRGLHVRMKVPIAFAIVGGAILYALSGAAIAKVIPRSSWTFWMSAGAVFALAVVVLRLQPNRNERPQRTPLPVYIKMPLIMGVIFLLILAKQRLHGFMTVFPMLGVVAAYEARQSLWTMSRQAPFIMLTLGAMMGAMRLVQPYLPSAAALAVGWGVFAAALALIYRLAAPRNSLAREPAFADTEDT